MRKGLSGDFVARDHADGHAAKHDKAYRDTVTGDNLPTKLVQSARQEEIKFMQDWGVGELRSVSEAVQVTGKQPLWGKWGGPEQRR